MRQLLIFMIVLAAAAVPAFAQKSGGAAKITPADEVRKAFETMMDGIRQSDAEKVMGVYDKNDRILFFNNNGSVTAGWDQMLENRKSSYAKAKNVTLDITGLRVEMLSPTSAYVTCKWKQTQEFEGKPESASGRMTLVFKKIGKEWKAVHAHTSPDNPPPARPVMPSERDSQ